MEPKIAVTFEFDARMNGFVVRVDMGGASLSPLAARALGAALISLVDGIAPDEVIKQAVASRR